MELIMSHTKFSLVSTVFNEYKRLEQTISDLNQQTLHPSEIIITDAGSTDGTYEMLLEWSKKSEIPIVVLQKNRCNVAEGRNMAIRAAKNELIVSTDFGCRFAKDWLNTLITPFKNPAVKVVGGAFGVLEDDIETIPAKAAYVLSAGYNVDVKASWFIPSSRSIAYYKEVYNKVGGYCEWLTLAADDLVFGKQIKFLGYSIYPVEHKGVFWGRHKAAVGYVKEAYRYGLGDGEAKVNTRSFLSNLTETIIRYVLLLLTIANVGMVITKHLSIPFLFINFLLLIGLRSYIGYTKNWIKFKSKKYNLKVFLYGFYLLEKTRQSYIHGYLKGYFFSTPFQKQQAQLLKQKL